jgi:hypothetical protein
MPLALALEVVLDETCANKLIALAKLPSLAKTAQEQAASDESDIWRFEMEQHETEMRVERRSLPQVVSSLASTASYPYSPNNGSGGPYIVTVYVPYHPYTTCIEIYVQRLL